MPILDEIRQVPEKSENTVFFGGGSGGSVCGAD